MASPTMAYGRNACASAAPTYATRTAITYAIGLTKCVPRDRLEPAHGALGFLRPYLAGRLDRACLDLDFGELVARVRARLRRTDEPAPEMLQIGDIVIDVAGHSVKRDGETLNLTPLEFDLLVALARKPRQVFTREVLLEQVWGYRHAADTRLVNVHVQRLRAKIEKDPEHPEIVVTVRGVGYKAGPG